MEEFKTEAFKVGKSIKVGDIFITINSFKDIPPCDLFPPGKKYLAVDVTIENQTAKAVKYNEDDFLIRDSQGYIHKPDAQFEDPPFDSGILPAHSKHKGWITFEIPKGSYAELIYQPQWWNGEQIVVKLE